MMEPFKPDYTGIDDLPAGFNSLPEDERGRIMAERVRLLHVYGQRVWHGELSIVGNRNALTVLRDAIDAALANGKAGTSAMVSDGEGYSMLIRFSPIGARC